MGSELKKHQKTTFRKEVRRTIKTKGDRLGWEPLENEKKVPLKDIVGEGHVVNTSCFVSIGGKFIL